MPYLGNAADPAAVSTSSSPASTTTPSSHGSAKDAPGLPSRMTASHTFDSRMVSAASVSHASATHRFERRGDVATAS